MVEIREELPADVEAIRALNDRAFGGDVEGRIVDALRAAGATLLSLVAVVDGAVSGHILYSPVTFAGGPTGAGLGPMCVAREHQRRGIGTRLVERGNRELARTGCPFIVVIGHPEYYPRFGFESARDHGIECEWEVPDPAFMVRVLDPAAIEGISGRVRYRPEFAIAEE